MFCTRITVKPRNKLKESVLNKRKFSIVLEHFIKDNKRAMKEQLKLELETQ